MTNLLIFDLDGVITSEGAYWDSAGLVLHELLYSPRYWDVGGDSADYHPATTAQETRRLSREVLPESLIVGLKARSVNSNWDTCYVGFCLYLIELLSMLPDCSSLLPLRPWQEDWIAAFREQAAQVDRASISPAMLPPLTDPFFENCRGFDLINRFDSFASEVLGYPIEGVFERRGPAWKFCKNLFQEWYLGEQLFTQTYGYPPAQPGKPGCINFEQPLLAVDRMRATLDTLRQQGYILGIATGRPRQEAILPLKNYGLLPYFDERHIATDVELMHAESSLRAQGIATSLGKPHPFLFLLAANPDYQPDDPLPPRGSFIVVGDTPSDVQGAHAAGAIAVSVLSGARTPEARQLLEESQPDFLIEDMTHVPALLARIDDLGTIQRLQFSEQTKAELLLQRWFLRYMDLRTESVTLAPKAVSLNSFNGIYRTGGEEYFFKTHVEEQGILQEYYHAELLSNAGYNVVRPLRTMRKQGQQMVVYPVVRWPVMFDLMRAVETGKAEQITVEQLAEAEQCECNRLLAIYRETLQPRTALENAEAPIHQLFWHRITGGRLKSFYEGQSLLAPGSSDMYVPFEKILHYHWIINGVYQKYTLGELIERAKVVLDPTRPAMTVIGHGDAHFGNVFLENERDYLYFDPAFAGHHSPLLDVIKPLFHNIFATWMYFPFEFDKELTLSYTLDEREQCILVDYCNYKLPPVREAILQTKITYLLEPLLQWLRAEDALPDDWLEIMQSALMCCPLLTVNLFDNKRMPTTIGWLGLVYAVHMGNNGIQSWKLGES